MGGMGALQIYLKNSDKYRSASAFAPISSASEAPLARNAFQKYLGSIEAGAQYDPTLLIADFKGKAHIFVDQGTNDKFLKEQLKPQ